MIASRVRPDGSAACGSVARTDAALCCRGLFAPKSDTRWTGRMLAVFTDSSAFPAKRCGVSRPRWASRPDLGRRTGIKPERLTPGRLTAFRNSESMARDGFRGSSGTRTRDLRAGTRRFGPATVVTGCRCGWITRRVGMTMGRGEVQLTVQTRVLADGRTVSDVEASVSEENPEIARVAAEQAAELSRQVVEYDLRALPSQSRPVR